MALHPEAQAKAQEEIDRVVGTQRLPDFGDRSNLPYVEAIYLETLRWRPVVPCGECVDDDPGILVQLEPASLALPRLTATSDIYEGMYVPKGELNRLCR